MNERDRAGTSADAVNIAFRSPLQGEARCNPSPGLKPWAMIYNRFAVSPPVASQGASYSSSSSNPATRSGVASILRTGAKLGPDRERRAT
jgi:hypothetical protein